MIMIKTFIYKRGGLLRFIDILISHSFQSQKIQINLLFFFLLCLEKFVLSSVTALNFSQLISLTHHKGSVNISGDSMTLILRSLTFITMN